MDHRVDIGKANVQHRVSGHRAIPVGNGIHAGQIFGGLQKIIDICHGLRRAAKGNGAIFRAYMGHCKAADLLQPRSVGSGAPAAHDDFLGAAGLAHEAAQQKRGVVISKDMYDLTVLQQRHQGAQVVFLGVGGNADHDKPRALYHLGHIRAGQIQKRTA